jgi:hypothetical protein
MFYYDIDRPTVRPPLKCYGEPGVVDVVIGE